LFDSTLCPADVNKVSKAKPTVVHDTYAESTLAATCGHGDLAGFDVQLMSVRLESNEVPLLNTACSACVCQDVGVGKQPFFCTVG
jgi:hypothetical protein